MRHQIANARPDPRTVRQVGERVLLERLYARIPSAAGVAVGPGDDAAVVHTTAVTLVTTDCLVEGVHFRRAWSSPRRLGRKALTVNLSDIAAMGGRSRYATLSLCLPADLEVTMFDELLDGVLDRATETGVALVGGNLSGIDGPLVVDVALTGESERPLLRSGARPGDLLAVTGTLGAASTALALLERGTRLGEDDTLEPGSFTRWTDEDVVAATRCLRAHLDPSPPLAFGVALAAVSATHAAIDVSDGLSGDLLALCRASGVSARIDSAAVPTDAAVARLLPALGRDPLEAALHGGEDYELLLAFEPAGAAALQAAAAVHGTRLSLIGTIEPGPPSAWLRSGHDVQPLDPRSYEHFRARRA